VAVLTKSMKKMPFSVGCRFALREDSLGALLKILTIYPDADIATFSRGGGWSLFGRMPEGACREDSDVFVVAGNVVVADGEG
jgi:hypothetical protein